MAGVAIGMMDPAFFVGRRAILEWLNSSFLMNREGLAWALGDAPFRGRRHRRRGRPR